MNDNYLWDRTGKPDPAVVELEQLLGELRYQPRALRIPPGIKAGRRFSYFPVAIAAGVALSAALAGLWLFINKTQSSTDSRAGIASSSVRPTLAAVPVNTASDNGLGSASTPRAPQERLGVRSRLTHRQARLRTHSPALTAEELAQKEQVMLALRLVSAKLNIARKSLAVPQSNSIRNHRIG